LFAANNWQAGAAGFSASMNRIPPEQF